jgi:hypothetical protein
MEPVLVESARVAVPKRSFLAVVMTGCLLVGAVYAILNTQTNPAGYTSALLFDARTAVHPSSARAPTAVMSATGYRLFIGPDRNDLMAQAFPNHDGGHMSVVEVPTLGEQATALDGTGVTSFTAVPTLGEYGERRYGANTRVPTTPAESPPRPLFMGPGRSDIMARVFPGHDAGHSVTSFTAVPTLGEQYGAKTRVPTTPAEEEKEEESPKWPTDSGMESMDPSNVMGSSMDSGEPVLA